MIDIARSKPLKNFTVLNKAFAFFNQIYQVYTVTKYFIFISSTICMSPELSTSTALAVRKILNVRWRGRALSLASISLKIPDLRHVSSSNYYLAKQLIIVCF